MSKIMIYAPGNGALDFVRVDSTGKACEPNQWVLLKNINMLSALKFWENNPSFYGM